MAIEIGSLKPNKSHIIILVLAALICFLLIDRGGIKSDLKQSLKDLKAEKSNSAAIQKRADGAIAAKEALKRESDKKLLASAGSLAIANAEIKKKNSSIADLEVALPGLKDKDAIIANQAQQITEWKSKCSLFEKKVLDLGEPTIGENGEITYPPGTVTFELSRKYETQLSITGQWVVKYDAVCVERDRGDKALVEVLKDLRWERFKSKAKTGVVAGAAGGILYFTGNKIAAYITWAVGFLNLIFGK